MIYELIYTPKLTLYYSPQVHWIFDCKTEADSFAKKISNIAKIQTKNDDVGPEVVKKNKFGFKTKRQKVSSESPFLSRSSEELEKILETKQKELEVIETNLKLKNTDRVVQVVKLVQYYGERAQNLLTEMHKENPTDPRTGELMSLKELIEDLKIKKDLIQWDDDEEDFKSFN